MERVKHWRKKRRNLNGRREGYPDEGGGRTEFGRCCEKTELQSREQLELIKKGERASV